MAFPIESLMLSVINIKGGTQARDSVDVNHVAELKEVWLTSPDSIPPIIVFWDGKIYWMADGFHRFLAANEAGRVSLKCEVRTGTQREARLFACGANCGHGLKRTNKDKRCALTMLFIDKEWSKWTDRKIAETVGVSHNFVAEFRLVLASDAKANLPDTDSSEETAESENEATEPRTGTDGRSYKKRASKRKPRKKKKPKEQTDGPADEQPDSNEPSGSSEESVPDTKVGSLTKKAADALAIISDFKTLILSIGRMEGEIERLCEEPGGCYLVKTNVLIDLKNAKSCLRTCQPVCPCPRCQGEGCTSCNKQGWWSDQLKRQLINNGDKAVLDKMGW